MLKRDQLLFQDSTYDNIEAVLSKPIENYSVGNGFIERIIYRRNNTKKTSRLKVQEQLLECKWSPSELFDKLWLSSAEKPSYLMKSNCTLSVADLFSGLGGMTLGVVEAGNALGFDVIPKFAIDFDKDAIDTYKNNFPTADCHNVDIYKIVDGEIGQTVTKTEAKLLSHLGPINIVIGGPPCQGHSDLNNYTRRRDSKNNLLLRVVRFTELFSPDHVIIENVQGVRHDKGMVTHIAKEHLKKLGYYIHDGLMMASNFGVAQNRRRYFLVATRSKEFDFSIIEKEYSKEKRPFSWACMDLINKKSKTIFDTSAQHSPVNQKRIEYLFKHNIYELPDEIRPNCHRDGNHSYKSVYGRMYLNKPSPTITSGFGSIGQGRFCHPTKHRSLTPHEAARLQFIPDFFRFLPDTKRVSFQKMIGNAVPSKLSYLLTLELLR